MIDLGMTADKLAIAQAHVKNVCSQGSLISLIGPGTKDEFGYITAESTLSLRAFPIRFSPYERQVTERISWAEDTDIICYVSKKSAIDDLSLTLEKIRRYKDLRYGSKTYNLKYVDFYNAFAGDFLYVVIGGKR